jgi:hypothetical protein
VDATKATPESNAALVASNAARITAIRDRAGSNADKITEVVSKAFGSLFKSLEIKFDAELKNMKQRVWMGLANKLAGPAKTRVELMDELKASLPRSQ